MNKFIEFIKRLFKKQLLLNEKSETTNSEITNQIEKVNPNKKEEFFNNVKVENSGDNIISMQMNLENGIIDESKLSNEQVKKIKELYCQQIVNLKNSIKNYKLKLNQN